MRRKPTGTYALSALVLGWGLLLAGQAPLAEDSPPEDTEDQFIASEADLLTSSTSDPLSEDLQWIDDSRERLPQNLKTTLLELIQTHERMTGQTLRLRIDSAEEVSPGPREILISIQTQERNGSIQSHFTLDPVLLPERIREITEDTLVPALRRETLELAIQRTLKALLEALESPVTATDLRSGEAASQLQLLPESPGRGWTQNLGWISVLLAFALGLSFFILQILTRFEVHISRAGGVPVNPFRQWWDEVRRAAGKGPEFEGDSGGLGYGAW